MGTTQGSKAGARRDGCADFESHLPLIEDVTSWVSRRQCLPREEAEDFAATVRLHLLEDDCAVLHRFSGRSRLSTYLTSVILNLARDLRVREWGRWRPSAAAQRMGTVAVQLETLTVRDGRSFRDAVETLRAQHGVDESEVQLAAMAERFPVRFRRRFVDDSALAALPAPGVAEERVRNGERRETLARAERALNRALAGLDSEDRLILKMRFQDGLKISAIAAALGLPARPLYRRLSRLLVGLRTALEAEGLSAEAVLDGLGWSGSGLRVDFDLASAPRAWNGPSHRAEDA